MPHTPSFVIYKNITAAAAPASRAATFGKPVGSAPEPDAVLLMGVFALAVGALTVGATERLTVELEPWVGMEAPETDRTPVLVTGWEGWEGV